MKKISFTVLLLSISFFFCLSQSPVKATLRLKDGKVIEAYHFGKLKCESNVTAPTFNILKGKFNGSHTEISDYREISKMEFSGFTAAPVSSVGNQKAKITVIKKSGVTVPLDDAELVMSCFNPKDRYNEIHVQIINPLTYEKADVAVEVKNIVSITF